MDVSNDIRAGDDQQVIVAPQLMRVLLVAIAPEVLLSQPEAAAHETQLQCHRPQHQKHYFIQGGAQQSQVLQHDERHDSRLTVEANHMQGCDAITKAFQTMPDTAATCASWIFMMKDAAGHPSKTLLSN